MRKHQEFRFTCSICHKSDWSPRAGAMYCSNRCKQIAYRQRKAQMELSQKMSLPMETFALFKHVTDKTPALIEPLTQFLIKHDRETFAEVLNFLTTVQTSS